MAIKYCFLDPRDGAFDRFNAELGRAPKYVLQQSSTDRALEWLALHTRAITGKCGPAAEFMVHPATCSCGRPAQYGYGVATLCVFHATEAPHTGPNCILPTPQLQRYRAEIGSLSHDRLIRDFHADMVARSRNYIIERLPARLRQYAEEILPKARELPRDLYYHVYESSPRKYNSAWRASPDPRPRRHAPYGSTRPAR